MQKGSDSNNIINIFDLRPLSTDEDETSESYDRVKAMEEMWDTSNAINFVIGVVYGGLAGYIGGRTDMILMRIVDRDRLSKVNSLTSIGSQGMIPIASVLAGVILEAFGGTALLAFCSAGFTVTALSLLFSRSFKEL